MGALCVPVRTEQGLALVDTGVGLHDHERPSSMVRLCILDFGLRRDPETTAARQLARRGMAPESNRHIVLTRLHSDHAGGLPDFPHAQVHVHRWEAQAFLWPWSWLEAGYDRADTGHGLQWVLYGELDCRWLGFDAIRLPFSPSVYLSRSAGTRAGNVGLPSKMVSVGCSRVRGRCPLDPTSV